MTSRDFSKNTALLNPEDTAILLIDLQSGLFQTVKDIPLHELRSNVTALAKVASIMKLPVITTASVPEGPNGPLMPELQEVAPHAQFVTRSGEINAFDNVEFVKAVQKSGRKTLVIAGVWTSVCVAFPALSALSEGYSVYAVIDASGNWSSLATQITIARLAQAGVQVIDTVALISELQRTWNRKDADKFTDLFTSIVPNYQAALEQHSSSNKKSKK